MNNTQSRNKNRPPRLQKRAPVMSERHPIPEKMQQHKQALVKPPGSTYASGQVRQWIYRRFVERENGSPKPQRLRCGVVKQQHGNY